MKGPKFLGYVIPLVEVLRESGGSGSAGDMIDRVIEKMEIPDSVVEETISSGTSRVRNGIQWARTYLVKADLISSEERGVWKLTEKGFDSDLNDEAVYSLFKSAQSAFQKDKKNKTSKSKEETEDILVEDEAHSAALLDILTGLSPSGFEILCKRLLTELGFHEIEITGKSGDQGIDGTGILRVNEVVGFNIIFQCKRYKESVSPHHVRDFRGTMQGRADKGIIITTGRFTSEAQKESVRDGVPPIELIDGEKLVHLFEKFKLGLKERVVFDVVPDFFDKYK